MSLKCYYQYDDGRFCKNWAMRGSRYCTNHQPPETPEQSAKLPLPPALRLTSPKEVLHILSEALAGAHMGTMTPGKAYSIGYLSMAWMKTFARVSLDAQEKAVRHQMLISMVDRASAELAEPPDFDPPSAPAQPLPAPAPAHDPWAAGRMAGPVPAPQSNPADPHAPPAAPLGLQEAHARLAEMLGFPPDADNEPLTPPSAPVAAGLPRHTPQEPSRSKPNGSAARSLGKSRDPAA